MYLGDKIWRQKTRVLGLPDGEEIMPLAFFVLIQYRRVTDRRTDRRTERRTDGWIRCDHYYPRSGKNVNLRMCSDITSWQVWCHRLPSRTALLPTVHLLKAFQLCCCIQIYIRRQFLLVIMYIKGYTVCICFSFVIDRRFYSFYIDKMKVNFWKLSIYST